MPRLVESTVLTKRTTPSSTNLVSQSALFPALAPLLLETVVVILRTELKDTLLPHLLVMVELLVHTLMDFSKLLLVPPNKLVSVLPLVLVNGHNGVNVTVIMEIKLGNLLSPRMPLMVELLVSDQTTLFPTKFVLQVDVQLPIQNVSTLPNAMMETNVLLTNASYNHLESLDATGLPPLYVTTAASVLLILVILLKDVSIP